jgi:dynein light chain LC8-type
MTVNDHLVLDMRILAINTVERIYDSNISNLEIATQIKETFEKNYYPTWICIVGKNFGCKINAQKRHYFCFQIETRTIILYKYH